MIGQDILEPQIPLNSFVNIIFGLKCKWTKLSCPWHSNCHVHDAIFDTTLRKWSDALKTLYNVEFSSSRIFWFQIVLSIKQKLRLLTMFIWNQNLLSIFFHVRDANERCQSSVINASFIVKLSVSILGDNCRQFNTINRASDLTLPKYTVS